MIIERSNIKTSYCDEYGHFVFTYLKNYGRVVLEEKIREEHLILRQNHWIDILNKVIAGEVISSKQVYLEAS